MRVNTDGDRRWGSVTPGFDSGRFVATATCDCCGAVKRWTAQSQPRPDVVVKKIEATGWATGKVTKCPECIKKSKEDRMNAKATVTPINTASPSPDLREKRREAHGLIDMAFDIGLGRYEQDYSDERIAKETGLPKEWVAKRREDEFGPIKEPNDLAVIRQEVATAKGVWEQAVKKLDDLCVRNGWRQ